jgi:hypothetical protein
MSTYDTILDSVEQYIENDSTYISMGRDPYGISPVAPHTQTVHTHYMIVPVSSSTLSRVTTYAQKVHTTPTDYAASILEKVY